MNARDLRRARIKKTVRGTADRPRLVVYRSNRYFYGQAIDDTVGKTLVSVNKATDSATVGTEIAKKLTGLKIKNIVFDRAGYKYHGNIKKIADSAREAGLEF